MQLRVLIVTAIEANHSFAFRQFARMRRTILRTLAFIIAGAPVLLLAQYSEIKMGEYLHYAVAAANGGVYAGIDGIGYAGSAFGTPSLYTTNTGWVDLPSSLGFNTTSPYIGQPKGISHDGSVVAGYMSGVATNGISTQYAVYWVNGVESLVPAPPDDPTPTTMSATGVSGDGTTLIVQDQIGGKTESYVFKIASGTFTSLGFFPGGTNQQTYATAINKDGTIVAGYYNLDDGDIHGFMWNATNGLTDMGIPASHPNTYYLEPTCISDDGTTVFGQLTEFNGWVGFRYNTTTGFQDLGGISPSACTADGTEAVGIEDLYFPAVWSVGNGGGYLDHLLSANGTPQALGTTWGPVTISPDGSAITAIGPDAYPADQIWYGTWQISLPVPLKTAAIPPAMMTFSTPYQETLSEPAGTLIQSADFNNGVSAVLVTKPHYASSFVLNADGSFTYTPKPGYISNGSDPENGTPNDRFTYQLAGPNGTSTNAVVRDCRGGAHRPDGGYAHGRKCHRHDGNARWHCGERWGSTPSPASVWSMRPRPLTATRRSATGWRASPPAPRHDGCLHGQCQRPHAGYRLLLCGLCHQQPGCQLQRDRHFRHPGGPLKLAADVVWRPDQQQCRLECGSLPNRCPEYPGLRLSRAVSGSQHGQPHPTPADADGRRQSFLQLHRTRRRERHHLWRAVERDHAAQRLALRH